MGMSSMVLGFSTGDQIGANLLQRFDLMMHGVKEPKTGGKERCGTKHHVQNGHHGDIMRISWSYSDDKLISNMLSHAV